MHSIAVCEIARAIQAERTHRFQRTARRSPVPRRARWTGRRSTDATP
jgi:hypothetical protein